MVVVLAALILAALLALRGYPPAAITEPVLILVTGAVTAAGRLGGAQHERATTPEPAP